MVGFTAFGDDVPVKQDAHLCPANIGFQAVMAFLYNRNFARPVGSEGFGRDAVGVAVGKIEGDACFFCRGNRLLRLACVDEPGGKAVCGNGAAGVINVAPTACGKRVSGEPGACGGQGGAVACRSRRCGIRFSGCQWGDGAGGPFAIANGLQGTGKAGGIVIRRGCRRRFWGGQWHLMPVAKAVVEVPAAEAENKSSQGDSDGGRFHAELLLSWDSGHCIAIFTKFRAGGAA